MPDDGNHALHLCGKPGQCLIAVTIKTIPQQQIFRRVSAQRQLGGQHNGGAGITGAPADIENLCGVALKITDSAVELRDGDLDRLLLKG